MYGYKGKDLCSYQFSRLWAEEQGTETTGEKMVTTCKHLSFKEETLAKMGSIQTVSVHQEDKTLYIFTKKEAYVLNLPLKDSFEESLKTSILLPTNPKPKQMTFLKTQALIYLD